MLTMQDYGLTIKFHDDWSIMPQVLAAWNDETSTFIGDPTAAAAGLPLVPTSQEVDDFLGVEVEATLTWHMYPGVDVDLIGSILFAGDGSNRSSRRAGSSCNR